MGWEKAPFDTAEAFAACLRDATESVPKGAAILGIKISFVYQTPDMDARTIEACGSTISQMGVDPRLVSKLLAGQAQDAYVAALEAGAPTPEPENTGRLLGRAPRKARRMRR